MRAVCAGECSRTFNRFDGLISATWGFNTTRRLGRAVIVAAIDNLGKGAAGQAVQNMNLVLGLEETAGLL